MASNVIPASLTAIFLSSNAQDFIEEEEAETGSDTMYRIPEQ